VPALRSRLFSLSLVPFVAAVLVLLPAIDVRAATPITFGFSGGNGLALGSPCIDGMAAVSAPIHIMWKGSSGQLKASVDMTTSLGGSWQYCSDLKHLRVGDTIKAVVQGATRTLTMLNVSIASDRTTEFHGRGPANQTSEVWYDAGVHADYQRSATVNTDSSGHWAVDIPDGLMGGLYAEVDWQTTKGDYFTARMLTPYVKVTLGAADVAAGDSAGATIAVKLRDGADSTIRGRATLTFDEWGSAEGQFVDEVGNPIAARVGDRVVSPLAPNLDWHIPNVTGAANVANDHVKGVCFATEISPLWAEVSVYRSGARRGFAIANTATDGSFVADFGGRPGPFYDPANIKHGDNVSIDCYYNTGDVVSTAFQVP